MVLERIWCKFKVKLSDVSVDRLLEKLGLSLHRLIYRALQRDEFSVFKWMTDDFPAIHTLAREDKAAIFFGYESSVRFDYHSGTTWAPIISKLVLI